ncbi:MAG: ECF-type sigma factor [Gemmatimonadota bacterium]|nr:ECF-type sigma factor [Gemmatimonadota bacterium]
MPRPDPSRPDPADPELPDQGEVAAEGLDALFTAAYAELHRLAATIRRDDPAATLTPTALVNEAWLKLRASSNLAPASRLHFKRIAGRAMRQVLVEAARRRNATKRGSGLAPVTFEDLAGHGLSTPDEVLALDEALEELGRVSPRQVAMIECRFFAGLDVAETAAMLEISEATVLRDWRAARAWLTHALSHPD